MIPVLVLSPALFAARVLVGEGGPISAFVTAEELAQVWC